MSWTEAIDFSDIESDIDGDNDTVGNPVLVDRLGYMLAPGNTVTKIADGTRFVVTTTTRTPKRMQIDPTGPTEWALYDDNNTSVSAENAMLDDTERHERASYCQHCRNHFNNYVNWQSGCGCIIEAELHYKRTKAKAAGFVFFFALKLVIIARRALRRMYSPGGSGFVASQIHFYSAADTQTPQIAHPFTR